MIVPTIVRRALASWLAWRDQERRYRACPALRDLDTAERADRAKHKPVRHYQRQRQALMHDMLRKGVHG